MNPSGYRSICRGSRTSVVPALLFAMTLTSALAQLAPATPVEGAKAVPEKPVPVEQRVAGDLPPEEAIVLSPFQVTTNNKGYFASNTMSGTRMNSKIEDLGQSITVMTKEQMTDFAMLDINDVFDYMASTEGTGSYSDFALDRTGAVTDNVQLSPNTANRVRGIGSANVAFNNIQTTGRVPVDPLWMDSLELSRGPNANIFGLGNASGTVNQVPATANLSRDFTRVEVRADSYDGWRASLDVNRRVTDKIALRASYANQHTGFVRKPSGEDARRLSFQLKLQPAKNTTVALSYFGYKNASVRPNFTTPRDYITNWFAAGKPAWDPITRLITIGGVTYGQGMVAGSTTPITTLPAYFSGPESRSIFRIGADGEAPFWGTPNITSPTSPFAGSVTNTIRTVNTTAANSFFGATQPLFASTPPLSDKSIYDWEHINLMANSKAWDDVDTYLGQIDQIFLNTQKQTLAAQVTLMREAVSRVENQPLGVASVNSTVGDIHIDPNTRNLDGTPNPYFGRPYARTTEPFRRDRTQLWDTARAQAVYRLDFTQDSGWSKWLGTQQVLGYYEYKNQQNRLYAYRHTATSLDQQWQKDAAAAGIPLANRVVSNTTYPASNNFARTYDSYYLGSTPGGGIEYGPSFFPEDATLPYVYGGNGGAFNYTPTTIGWTPSPDGSGGNASAQTVVKTLGGVVQSSFLNSKLVTTFGLRQDTVYDRNAPFATLSSDLRSFDLNLSNRWNTAWRMAEGKTKSASIVARPFKDIKALNHQIDSGSALGKLFAEAVTGFTLTFNKSDNFIASGPAVDLFLRPLPNQTGESKDIGFWMTLFDAKMSIRYTHFDTKQLSYRDGDINVIAQRVLRADGLNSADPWNLQDRSTEWIRQLNPTWTTDQVKAEVARTMGLSQAQIDGLEGAITAGTLAAPQDVISKGDELEINFNPTNYWTVSASVTKTESINQNAGGTIQEWIDARLPIWSKVEDPRFTQASPGGAAIPVGATGHLLWREIFGSNFTAFNYNATNSAATNYVTFVDGPLSVYRQLEGRPRPEIRKYSAKFNTKYRLAGFSENRFLRNMSVGGSLRWLDKAAIGYYGVQTLPAKITALDTSRPIYSRAETPIDLFVTYQRKLFGDKVRASFQFNVKNVLENGGGLRATKSFPDGSALAYRIIDPRQFVLSASFEL